MEKICIVTLHRVFNYGSILQAYASQKVFEKLGYDVEIIDYITEQRTNKRLFLSIPPFVRKDVIHRTIYLFAKALSVLLKKWSFGSFIKKHVTLSSDSYITAEDLKRKPPMADIYVAGSDQVWNSTYNEGIDEGFFLNFISNTRKIAYASSFGKTELEEWEREKTKRYLSDFSAISVREQSAVTIVSELGLKSACILDPTLQLDRTDWIMLASRRLIKKNYLILMLLYQEDNGATDYARKLADEMGLKLVKLSWELRKPPMVDILMTHRKPEDFLSLFYYADFVVTNSFHGLAFSINLHKEFVIFPRNEYNSRIESLLQLVGLQERMLTKKFETSFKTINYQSVEQRLEQERGKSKRFLQKALNRREE